MVKIIKIFKDEEIPFLIDRLKSVDEDSLVLLIPPGFSSLQTVSDFQLLKREIDLIDKRISIASADLAIINLARRTGFSIKQMSVLNQSSRKIYDIIPPTKQPSIDIEDLFDEEPAAVKEKLPLRSSQVDQDRPIIKEIKEEIKSTFRNIISQSTEDESEIKNESQFESESKIKTENRNAQYPPQQFLQKRKINNETEFHQKKIDNDQKDLGSVSRYSNDRDSQKEKKSFIKQFFLKPTFGIILILILVIGGYLYLFSGVTVTVNTLVSPINLDLNILAGVKNPVVDSSKNQVPAQLIRVEKSLNQKFIVTGEKEVETKARGKIIVLNAFSSVKQFLKIDTRFRSDGGKIFKSITSMTVPGAKIEDGKVIPSRTEVEVIADDIGSDYNIAPTNFTIPGFEGTSKFKGFTGESVKAMSGGAKGKVKVVTASDIEKAKSELGKRLSENLKSGLFENIPKNLEFLPAAYREDIFESVAKPGLNEIGETFEYRISGQARGLIFDKNDVEKIITFNLSKELKPDDVLVNVGRKLDYALNRIDFDNGLLELKLTLKSGYYKKIDEDLLKENLLGKSEDAVKSILLGDKRIDSAQISFWPFWIKSVPTKLDRIQLKVVNSY
ncbi:hypothetical protein HY061_03195 [Candidatus Azambacteria bacterium]|nr:hypothetical protein [Candidatus Azambacteria bacterium]